MVKRVQHVRHDTSGANTYTGLIGEFTLDTSVMELRLHDGSTQGGHRLLNLAQLQAIFQPLDGDLTALAALSATTGLMARTGANAFIQRTLLGSVNQIDIANGTGSGGNPAFTLSATLVLPGTFTTAGLATFQNAAGVTTNTITERTAGAAVTFVGAGIKVDEIVEKTADTGVTVEDVLIKDGNIHAILPAGIVAPFAAAVVPSGWLECDGAAVDRTTYAALFAAIGTTYGPGNGSSTFNLPDYRGEFLRGWAHGSTNDPDKATRTSRGDGTTGDNVGTKQASEFEEHVHDIQFYPAGANASWRQGQLITSVDTDNPQTAIAAVPVQATGGNETRPRNVNVMYIIKT